MNMLLLATLLCFTDPVIDVQVGVVKHIDGVSIIGNDAQCCECPCWNPGPPPYTQCGCMVQDVCAGGCGYQEISQFGMPWGGWTNSDGDGCVDMDLLPVPQEEWVYWVEGVP